MPPSLSNHPYCNSILLLPSLTIALSISITEAAIFSLPSGTTSLPFTVLTRIYFSLSVRHFLFHISPSLSYTYCSSPSSLFLFIRLLPCHSSLFLLSSSLSLFILPYNVLPPLHFTSSFILPHPSTPFSLTPCSPHPPTPPFVLHLTRERTRKSGEAITRRPYLNIYILPPSSTKMYTYIYR